MLPQNVKMSCTSYSVNTVATNKGTVACISANNSHSLSFIFFIKCKTVAKDSNHSTQNYLQNIVILIMFVIDVRQNSVRTSRRIDCQFDSVARVIRVQSVHLGGVLHVK